MMTTFEHCYNKLRIVEGGFANHKDDRGGMTFCGISRVHHPDWIGWELVDAHMRRGEDPDTLLKTDFLMALVKKIYREEFWEALHLNDFPQVLASEIFDSAVNCGKKRAVIWLQHAMNLLRKPGTKPLLVEDGIMGPVTRAKVSARCSNYGTAELLKAMNGQQYMHYQNLVEGNESQLVFFRGWLKRVWEAA